MGVFTVGDVVLVPFPFADFTRYKKRPALIVGRAEFGNVILCQITSQSKTSKRAIELNSEEFEKGNLPIRSYVRPDKLFTLEQSIIENKLGIIKTNKLVTIKLAVKSIFE